MNMLKKGTKNMKDGAKNLKQKVFGKPRIKVTLQLTLTWDIEHTNDLYGELLSLEGNSQPGSLQLSPEVVLLLQQIQDGHDHREMAVYASSADKIFSTAQNINEDVMSYIKSTLTRTASTPADTEAEKQAE